MARLTKADAARQLGIARSTLYKLIDQGIPDEAYKDLTGDDKAVCRDLKKKNKESNRGMAGVQGGEVSSAGLSVIRRRR